MGRVSFVEKLTFMSEAYLAADEHNHQVAYFEMLRKTQVSDIYDICYSIPNGGSRNPVEAQNLVMEGVKAGIPDIHHALPVYWADGVLRFHSLYTEFKTMKREAKPSEKQIKKMELLRNQGNAAFVVHGWFQGWQLWQWYCGFKSESEILTESGLNLEQQRQGIYTFDSWRFPL